MKSIVLETLNVLQALCVEKRPVKKLLYKQTHCRSVEMPCRSWDITVITFNELFTHTPTGCEQNNQIDITWCPANINQNIL